MAGPVEVHVYPIIFTPLGVNVLSSSNVTDKGTHPWVEERAEYSGIILS